MQSSVTRPGLAGTHGAKGRRAQGERGRTLTAGLYPRNVGQLEGDFKWHGGMAELCFKEMTRAAARAGRNPCQGRQTAKAKCCVFGEASLEDTTLRGLDPGLLTT